MKITSTTVTYERNYQVAPYNMIRAGGSITADIIEGESIEEERGAMLDILKSEVKLQVIEAIRLAKGESDKRSESAMDAIKLGRKSLGNE